jgi:hypothetical protein
MFNISQIQYLLRKLVILESTQRSITPRKEKTKVGLQKVTENAVEPILCTVLKGRYQMLWCLYAYIVYGVFALTCEGDHHVVEDNSHAIVEQRLTKHHEVQVRIHSNLVVKNTKLTLNKDFLRRSY